MSGRQTHSEPVKVLPPAVAALLAAERANSLARDNVTRSQSKLRLGINARTGRLQWCPGISCCKIIFVIPVIMVPILLVLVLLMRMDGMLWALQQQQQQLEHTTQQQQQKAHLYGYPVKGEHFRTERAQREVLLTDAERIRRCISFKFGLSETLDAEDRDIMRDARTSFLSQEMAAIPRECLEPLGYSYEPGRFNVLNDYMETENEADKNRWRRQIYLNGTQQAESDVFENIDGIDDDNEELNETDDVDIETDDGDTDGYGYGDIGVESVASVRSSENNESPADVTASLQSFWNEQGTKESIRLAQANTMKKYIDTSIDPCVDFYKFACGKWESLHPIPRDKAGFDTFEMLRENLDSVLRQLLESSDEVEMPKLQSNQVPRFVDPNAGDAPEHAVAAKISIQFDIKTDDFSAKKSVPQKDHAELNAEQLRHHIMRKRNVLGLLLARFKRESTSTKRKRLIAPTRPSLGLNTHKSDFDDAHRKARQLYQSCINTELLQQRGIEPLLQLIESLGGWPVLSPNWNEHKFDWLDLAARLRRFNNDILLVEWVGPDIKNSDENVIQFDQTSLGLPTREYFLHNANSRYLQAYQRFMAEVMNRLGVSRELALHTANDIINFETQLASITSPAEERLNVTKLYKRMTLKDLHDTVPGINWKRYLTILQQRNVDDNEMVVVYALNYMQELVNLLSQSRPRTVANYMIWRFVRHRINNVDDRFEDIKQNFYHTLFGREESPSRWKVCIAQVNTNMGMALGSLFVRRYFDENSKRDTLRMTHELQEAFREILKSTDWIDANTKRLATLKVNAMSLKIGYPDFILNPHELNEKYAGINIHPDRYFENTINVLLHTAKTEQAKLHESVNKTTWQTAPAIVNAYYSRNKNQIMFPAGILQPPFYHRHFPRSLNFGGIGVVIGHELTHGFDDKGRLFDRNGSIHKWWTDESIKGFDERARCIIAQYNNYTVSEVGIAINGESTQGENIADNGGIRQAFRAYKNWLSKNPDAAADESLPGINMTGEQLFFLNFGQVWCGAMRPEAVRNKLNTAIHSPGRFRVIGTLSNSVDFAREFQCPIGSPMNPEHKCSVW